jgi:hypothetical protein
MGTIDSFSNIPRSSIGGILACNPHSFDDWERRLTVVGSGTLPARKPMHTRPTTLKCRVATVLIAVPGPPRTRMGPLVWNCPRCEFRRDFCIECTGWSGRTEKKNGGMRGLSAGWRIIQCCRSRSAIAREGRIEGSSRDHGRDKSLLSQQHESRHYIVMRF